jgi:hypothetical protein
MVPEARGLLLLFVTQFASAPAVMVDTAIIVGRKQIYLSSLLSAARDLFWRTESQHCAVWSAGDCVRALVRAMAVKPQHNKAL